MAEGLTITQLRQFLKEENSFKTKQFPEAKALIPHAQSRTLSKPNVTHPRGL